MSVVNVRLHLSVYMYVDKAANSYKFSGGRTGWVLDSLRLVKHKTKSDEVFFRNTYLQVYSKISVFYLFLSFFCDFVFLRTNILWWNRSGFGSAYIIVSPKIQYFYKYIFASYY